MANNNSLIIEVIGDTSKLKRGLGDAQQQINRFAGRSKIGQGDKSAEQIARTFMGGAPPNDPRDDEANRRAAEALDARDASLRRFAIGAGVAGIAVNRLGANFRDAGGNLGKFGSAVSDLSSGNIVGFVKGLQSINNQNPKKIAQDLLDLGDASKALHDAAVFSAIGLDQQADAAKNAAAQIVAMNNAFVDNTKIHDSTSAGALSIEIPNPAKVPVRPGVSQSQRNTFFDNDITRDLDRVQDSDLRAQVTKLKAIGARIQERIDAQKDVTRKLKLEDDLAGVDRQRRGVETTIAQRAADAAELRRLEARERAAKERAARLAAEAREAARIQATQFRALGLGADGGDVVPGADNLRKQFESLTSRIGDSSLNLSSKLDAQLEGAQKVLSGRFGKITEESRRRIQDLFDTIRGEFDKGGNGPLTKTTSLNTNRILEGLGLSPEDERAVRSRLSSFNSGGQALAAGPGSQGAFGQPLVVKLQVDSKTVAEATVGHTTRLQQRRQQANPTQKRGR